MQTIVIINNQKAAVAFHTVHTEQVHRFVIHAEQKADAGSLTEADFSQYLFSAGVPDPDLVIRPSGELRLSNFLPWQTTYSEFYFTDVLWPDFDEEELHKALCAYQKRTRRFGGVK